jgi:hypothetical protein
MGLWSWLGLGYLVLDLGSLVLGPKGFALAYLVLGVWWLRVLCLGSWSWVFGLGFLVLGFWSWVFGLGYLVLSLWSWVLDFRSLVLDFFAYD